MRRSFLLPSLVLTVSVAFLLLTAGTLSAQEWIVGPPVVFPDAPSNLNQETGNVRLNNGHVVIAAESSPTGLPEDSQLNFLTVDPQEGSIVASWTRPAQSSRPISMIASGDQFLLLHNPGGLNVDPEFLGTLMDPVQGGDAANSFRIDSFEVRADTVVFDVARLQDGRLIAVWRGPGVPGGSISRIIFQLFEDDGTLIGEAETVASVRPGELHVVPAPDGGFLVTWRLAPASSGLFSRRFDSNGAALGPIQALLGDDEGASAFEISAFQNGNFFLTWNELDPFVITPPQLLGRRLNSQGQPFAETLTVAPLSDTGKVLRQSVSDSLDRIWVLWGESGDIFLRQVEADGSLSSILQVPPAEAGQSQGRPRLSVDEHGRALVSWRETSSTGFLNRLEARTVELDRSCMEGDTMLCLHQGRFQVEIEWTDHSGDIGPGRVVPFQSSDSGLFWFFDEANWEVMVKVINGCDFNGFYWIFSAATTDVAYDLKVTDTDTGLEQIYSNSLGEPAPANTDTTALMSCGHGPP